jgi:hypothetical protein
LNSDLAQCKEKYQKLQTEFQALSASVPATREFIGEMLEKIDNGKITGYKKNNSQELFKQLRRFYQSLTQIP